MSVSPIKDSFTPLPAREDPAEVEILRVMQALLSQIAHLEPEIPQPRPPLVQVAEEAAPTPRVKADNKVNSLLALLHGASSNVEDFKKVQKLFEEPVADLKAPAAPKATAAAPPITSTELAQKFSALTPPEVRKHSELEVLIEKCKRSPVFGPMQVGVEALFASCSMHPSITLFELISFDIYKKLHLHLPFEMGREQRELLLKEYAALFLRGLLSFCIQRTRVDERHPLTDALPFEGAGGEGPLMTGRFLMHKLELFFSEKIEPLFTTEGELTRKGELIKEGICLLGGFIINPEIESMLHYFSLLELQSCFPGVAGLKEAKPLEAVSQELTHYASFLDLAVQGGLENGLMITTGLFSDFRKLIEAISKEGMKFADVESLKRDFSKALQSFRTHNGSYACLCQGFLEGRVTPRQAAKKTGLKVAASKFGAAFYIANSQYAILSGFLKDLMTTLEVNYLQHRYAGHTTSEESLVNRFMQNAARAASYQQKPSSLTASLEPLTSPFSGGGATVEAFSVRAQEEISRAFTRSASSARSIRWEKILSQDLKQIGVFQVVGIPLLRKKRANLEKLERLLEGELRALHRQHVEAILSFLKTLPKEELLANREAYLSYIQELFFRLSLPFMLVHLQVKDTQSLLEGESRAAILTAEEYLTPPQAIADYGAAEGVEAFFDSLIPPPPTPKAETAKREEPATPAAAKTAVKKAAPAAPAAPAKMGAKKAVAAAAPAAPPVEEEIPLPKSGDNRWKYVAKLLKMGWTLHNPTGGSHYTAEAPSGEKIPIAMGGTREEFGADTAARFTRNLRDKKLI